MKSKIKQKILLRPNNDETSKKTITKEKSEEKSSAVQFVLFFVSPNQ